METDLLSYGGTGHLLTVVFDPTKICMLPESGRIYHPGPDRAGGVGLIKSSLAIELSKNFSYDHGDDTQPPTHFTWKDVKYVLTNEIIPVIHREYQRQGKTVLNDD